MWNFHHCCQPIGKLVMSSYASQQAVGREISPIQGIYCGGRGGGKGHSWAIVVGDGRAVVYSSFNFSSIAQLKWKCSISMRRPWPKASHRTHLCTHTHTLQVVITKNCIPIWYKCTHKHCILEAVAHTQRTCLQSTRHVFDILAKGYLVSHDMWDRHIHTKRNVA